jgi:hypothetical protein
MRAGRNPRCRVRIPPALDAERGVRARSTLTPHVYAQRFPRKTGKLQHKAIARNGDTVGVGESSLGFRVLVALDGVRGFGFRVSGFGFQGFGFPASISGFRVSYLGLADLEGCRRREGEVQPLTPDAYAQRLPHKTKLPQRKSYARNCGTWTSMIQGFGFRVWLADLEGCRRREAVVGPRVSGSVPGFRFSVFISLMIYLACGPGGLQETGGGSPAASVLPQAGRTLGIYICIYIYIT